MRTPFCLSSVLVFSSVLASAGAQLTWQRVFPATTPDARYGHAMAFHEARGRIVLFGGATDNVLKLDDTWEYDGQTWRLMTPVQRPPARRWHSMVYDAVNRSILLFGGDSATSQGALNDVWQYDVFGNWQPYLTLSGPSGRFAHAASFDWRTGTMVVFGGYVGATAVDECWLLSPPSRIWTRYTGATPPARVYPGMVFDTTRNVTVLTGGAADPARFSDTWEFDGTWRNRSIISAPLQQISLAYDSVRQRVLFFGGLALIGTNNSTVDSFGEYDGTAWTFRQISRPGRRTSARLAFDSARGKTVLFGGSTFPGVLNDTWTLASAIPAAATAFGTSCGGTTPSLAALAPADRPWIDSTFQMRLSNLPTIGLAGIYLGASRTTWAGIPLPFDLTPLGMTNCQQLVSGELLQNANANGDLVLRIPASASLNGQQFFAQGVAFAPGANSANLVTSNALAMTVGLR